MKTHNSLVSEIRVCVTDNTYGVWRNASICSSANRFLFAFMMALLQSEDTLCEIPVSIIKESKKTPVHECGSAHTHCPFFGVCANPSVHCCGYSLVPMAQLFATGIYTTIWTLPIAWQHL